MVIQIPPRLRRFALLIWPIIVFVVLNGLNTITGNWGEKKFKDSLEWANKNFDPLMWSQLYLCLFAIGVMVLVVWACREWYVVSMHRQERNEKMLSLDNSLLLLLPRLNIPNAQMPIERLMEEFLRDTLPVLGSEVNRAYILLPTGDWLKPKFSYGMPQTTIGRSNFYIASRSPETGIAGKAYLSGQTQIVRFVERTDGRWFADDSDYKEFEPGRTNMPYKVLVAVPIIELVGGQPRCLGVICYDSQKVDAFNGEEMATILLRLSERAACALRLSGQV